MTTEPWGRVDEEGNVFLRTTDGTTDGTTVGERQVGSWQAGSPDEALAFYARKYENLRVEIDLLGRRVRGEGGATIEPDEAAASIERLRATVAEANVVGDLGALTTKLDGLVGVLDSRREELAARKVAAKEAARGKREAIVAEGESLSESTSWKATGERYRTLLDEWKAAPRIDRPTEQALWKRFSAARTAFDRRRRVHFAELGSQREDAKAAKERLVTEAESLATSTDWGPTAARFRSLMTEWKAAGRAGRADDEALWERYRAAQDAFFNARNATMAERDVEHRANLATKEAILVDAEALLPVADPKIARVALRGIHDRWEAAGHVPRGDRDRVEGRLRVVDDAVRGAEESQWKRTNPEARARAEETATALRESIAKLEKQLAKAEAADDTRKAQEARDAIAARHEWLAEAEKALADFSN